MIDASRPGQARTTKLSAKILKLLFCLRVDFYHQLLATFMADMLRIRPSLKLPTLLDDALINQGGMGQLMPLLKQGELITPTYRLYELWCGAFSAPGESLSYRAMAMHLPCPDPGRTRVGSDSDQQDIESIVNETRHSRLKEWRGGTVPNTDQLTAFLESMTGETYGAFLPFIMTRVATAWTKWIEQERAMLGQLVQEHPPLAEDMDLDWLVERFSRYPQYWEHSKARANQK